MHITNDISYIRVSHSLFNKGGGYLKLASVYKDILQNNMSMNNISTRHCKLLNSLRSKNTCFRGYPVLGEGDVPHNRGKWLSKYCVPPPLRETLYNRNIYCILYIKYRILCVISYHFLYEIHISYILYRKSYIKYQILFIILYIIYHVLYIIHYNSYIKYRIWFLINDRSYI